MQQQVLPETLGATPRFCADIVLQKARPLAHNARHKRQMLKLVSEILNARQRAHPTYVCILTKMKKLRFSARSLFLKSRIIEWKKTRGWSSLLSLFLKSHIVARKNYEVELLALTSIVSLHPWAAETPQSTFKLSVLNFPARKSALTCSSRFADLTLPDEVNINIQTSMCNWKIKQWKKNMWLVSKPISAGSADFRLFFLGSHNNYFPRKPRK